MKRKTVLTVVASVALVVALIYLVVMALSQFGILSQEQTEETLFVRGYFFLPLPLVGLVAAVLLQAYSVRSAKKKKR
jgi:TRAP-type C4-dicarboxylate transport system permease small subunit